MFALSQPNELPSMSVINWWKTVRVCYLFTDIFVAVFREKLMQALTTIV